MQADGATSLKALWCTPAPEYDFAFGEQFLDPVISLASSMQSRCDAGEPREPDPPNRGVAPTSPYGSRVATEVAKLRFLGYEGCNPGHHGILRALSTIDKWVVLLVLLQM